MKTTVTLISLLLLPVFATANTTSLARDGRGTEGEGKVAQATTSTPQDSHTSRGNTRDSAQAAIRLALNDTPIDINIKAQKLSTALLEFSQQANIQILTATDTVADLNAPAIQGRMAPEQALQKLLTNTNLKYHPIGNNAIAIENEKTLNTGTGNTGDGTLRVAQNTGEENKGEAQETTAESSDKTNTETDRDSASDSSRSGIPEILVKGNRSMNAEIKRDQDDVQPYVVFSAQAIQRSGVSDVESFLRQKLTATTSQPSFAFSQGSNGNATSFNLRGLDTDETLILVNGRRVASWGSAGSPQQPDIGGIPLAAIERIEVLGSTASGIFGGGATGGVINIVLKQAYNGLDVTTSFENPIKSSAPVRKIGLSGGLSPNGGRTSIMLMGAFSESSPLLIRDRDYARAAREMAIQNDRARFYSSTPPLGATTNIRSSNGSLLQLKPQYGGTTLPSSVTHVPYGYGGVSSDNGAGLVAAAGRYNIDPAGTAQLGGNSRALLNSPTIKSLSTTIRHRITERFDGFGEFAISENLGAYEANPNGGIFSLGTNVSTNPFNQPITVVTPVFGQDYTSRSSITNRRALAGVALNLTKNWHMEAEYSWSSSRFYNETQTTLPASGSSAVTSGSLNVIQDSPTNPLDFSAFTPGTNRNGPSETTLKNPAIRLGGFIPLKFPGGNPSLSALVEYRRLDLDDAYSSTPTSSTLYPSRWQSTKSLYLESRIPFFSEKNALPGLKLLEVQLAGRHDKYVTEAANAVRVVNNVPTTSIARTRGSLSSTDPTVGFRYKPITSLTWRASYATGFLPPTVNQLVPSLPVATALASAFPAADPLRGNEPLGGRTVTLQSGGNPDLGPEFAKSWTLGFIFAPAAVPDLRFSVDRTEISKVDNIGLLTVQNAIDNDAFLPGRIVRSAPTPQNDPRGFGVGPIIQVNQSLINVAKTDIEAIDVALDYRWQMSSIGMLNISLKGTRAVHNVAQITPISTPTERVGLLNASLRWGGNLSLIWERSNWSAGWETQYIDKYWLQADRAVNSYQGSATIPRQVYHDVFFSYGNVGAGSGSGVWWSGDSLLSNLSFQVGIENVLNKRPPIVASDDYGYSRLADPRRARYYINIQKHF